MNSSSSPGRDKYRALLSSASKTAGSDNVSCVIESSPVFSLETVGCSLLTLFHSTPFFQWKTSAGRLDGPDSFVLGDAWRCIKLQFKSNAKPSVCPVCLEKPVSESSDWYITKSCKHAVCTVRDLICCLSCHLIFVP